jgi:hypothetical protein
MKVVKMVHIAVYDSDGNLHTKKNLPMDKKTAKAIFDSIHNPSGEHEAYIQLGKNSDPMKIKYNSDQVKNCKDYINEQHGGGAVASALGSIPIIGPLISGIAGLFGAGMSDDVVNLGGFSSKNDSWNKYMRKHISGLRAQFPNLDQSALVDMLSVAYVGEKHNRY